MQKFERNLSHNIEKLKDHKYFSIQKVFASPHYIILSCRAPGETFFLYIGKGAKYNGLWYCEANIDPKFRIRDRWNQYIKKHVVGFKITKIWIENEIVACLDCEKVGTLLISYFNSSLKVGIRDKDGFVTLPWGEVLSYKDFLDKEVNKSFIGQVDISENNYGDLLEDLESKSTKNSSKKVNKKKNRKILNIENDLEALRKSLTIWDKVIASEIDLSENEYKFNKLKLKFEKEQSYESKRNDILNRLKRYKKAVSLLEKRVEETKQKEESKEIELTDLPKLEPEWRQYKQSLKKKVDGEFKQYQALEYTIYEGINAKSNDFIRNSLSNKGDWWFHDESNPSQHVILKCEDDRLDIALLELVGQIFLLKTQDHSQANLIYTKVKYLKSVKGKPGLVRYSKEKSITVFKNQELMEKITLISSDS